jgi:hypothetical protein
MELTLSVAGCAYCSTQNNKNKYWLISTTLAGSSSGTADLLLMQFHFPTVQLPDCSVHNFQAVAVCKMALWQVYNMV